MSENSVVRARIDRGVKERASDVLHSMGLTVSDAIRLMLIRVAADKALPFDLKVPNAETIEAMAEVSRGGLASYDTVEDLMASLNAPD